MSTSSASPDRSAPPGTIAEAEEVSVVELLVTRCAGLDVAKDEVVARPVHLEHRPGGVDDPLQGREQAPGSGQSPGQRT